MLLNGTVIDIPGVAVQVIPIDLEDSTDIAHVLTITDGQTTININISYGKITSETIRRSVNE